MKIKALSWNLRLALAAALAGCAVQAPVQDKNAAPTAMAPVAGDAHQPAYGQADDPALSKLRRDLAQAQARGDTAQQARARADIGYALYLKGRGASAKPEGIKTALGPALAELEAARGLAQASKDAALEGRVGIVLGMARKDSGETPQASGEFRRSLELAQQAGDTALRHEARLQLAGLERDPAQRLAMLKEVAEQLPASPGLDQRAQVSLLLNLIDQLREMGDANPPKLSKDVQQLGQRAAERAIELAADQPRARSQAEGYLASLYAQENRSKEATKTLLKAIEHSHAAAAPDLTLAWETRLGQWLTQQGQEQRAIAAYRRAADAVSKVRGNIPIYQDGDTSYKQILEPIYRGLADLLTRAAQRAGKPQEQQQLLAEAIQSMELLKQSELEDYFNDRCVFDSAKQAVEAVGDRAQRKFLKSTADGLGKTGELDAILRSAAGGTAILYPILFKDRMEVILIHDGSIRSHRIEAGSEAVSRQAGALADILRVGGDYRATSHQLYHWLMAPLESELETAQIKRVAYVPDGALRLVPLSALGRQDLDFVANRPYTVTTNSGLQGVRLSPGGSGVGTALLAGLSKPGEEFLNNLELPDTLLAALSSKQTARGASGPGQDFETQLAKVRAARGTPEFRAMAAQALNLPEVEKEIAFLHKTLPSDPPLLNQAFTKLSLAERFKSGGYQIAHIATHGYFGGSADESFIIAYDNLVKVAEIEDILRPANASSRPVELVTFSACQTAQGDDRAPLGFSGLAVKAKARNAIGALWSVPDEATRRFMEEYYSALEKIGGDKAHALQIAQRALLNNKNPEDGFYHPSKWAPFILVGAW